MQRAIIESETKTTSEKIDSKVLSAQIIVNTRV